MDLQITGKIIKILPEQSGKSARGEWRKQEFVLETQGDYPKQICMMQWGDNIEKFGVKDGETLTAYIDLSSREYNGRWYTDVKVWRVDRPQAGAPGGAPPANDLEPWPEPPADADGDGDDGLPF